MRLRKDTLISLASGSLLVFLTGAVLSVALTLPASATVQFAKETNMACGACHVAPSGGGPLTPYGVKFQANGNKAPS